MTVPSSPHVPLIELAVGTSARLTEIRGGRKLARRLAALGLRVGSELTVLHRRGGGLVLTTGASRIALGGGIVEKLWVEPLPLGRESAGAAPD